MKKKGITRKDILSFSILTFVVVCAWIGFTIYHTIVTSTITEDLQMAISPITPSFDMDTLKQLKTRQRIEPIDTLQNVPTQTNGSPTPVPAASGSAGLIP